MGGMEVFAVPQGERLPEYKEPSDELPNGWQIGSGPVESACLQRQGRFKRSGQSWTPPGLRHLCALIEARQNGHWDHLWNQ